MDTTHVTVEQLQREIARLRARIATLEARAPERPPAQPRLPHHAQLLFEATGAGVYELDRRGHCTFINQAGAALLGYQPDDLLGRHLHAVIHHSHPDGTPYAEHDCPIVHVLQEGRSVRALEEMLWRRDGSGLPVAYSCFPMTTEGTITGATVIFTDQSERRQAEAALRYRVALEQCITTISTRFINLSLVERDAALNEALQAIGELAGVDRSYLFQFAPDGASMSNTHEWCAPGIAPQIDQLQALPTSAFPWWVATLRRFETIHVPCVADMPAEAHAEQAILQAQGIKSVLVVPLVSNQTLVGFLGFDAVRTTKVWADEDIALLHMLGDLIVTMLERQRVTEALVANERRFRALIEQSTDAVALLAADATILYASPSTTRILGYPLDLFVGRSAFDFIHPDDQAHTRAVFAGLVSRPGSLDTAEYRLRHQGGTWRWIEGVGKNMLDEPGVQAVVVNYRDITERRQTEAALRVLAEASSLLASSLDYDATLAAVARLVVPHLADLCTINMREGDGTIQRVASAFADPAKAPLMDELDRHYPVNPDAPNGVARVLHTGEPLLIPELTDAVLATITRDPEHLRLLRSLQLRSLMIVPLVTRGRVLGTMSLVASESGRRYQPPDLVLAQDVANRAALAVDNARLFHEAQVAEEQSRQQAVRMQALAEASRAFAEASLDLQAVLEAVARRVAELIGDVCAIRLLSSDRQWLEPVVMYHPDPAALADLRASLSVSPHRIDEGLTGQVARTGKPLLLPVVTPDVLIDAKPEYRAFWERFGRHSVLIMPLKARGQVIGTLYLSRQQPGRPYTTEDQILLQDLAERAALAIDSAQLYREAQEAIRARDQFLSIAAHELKTPVAGIKSTAQLVLRLRERGQLDDQRLTRWMKLLNETTTRLATLTDDLLDVARIRTGHLPLRRQPMDLAALVREVIGRYQDQAPPAVRLTVDERVDPCPLEADASRLEQVLTNLLDNAVKYSPDGAAIAVTLQPDGEGVLLTVRDQGIGLPGGEEERIFQPFGRTENATERNIPGMGLGLYICRSIVERHGGRIWAESPGEDQGTSVHVWLPGASGQ